jgi:hypothetical protein
MSASLAGTVFSSHSALNSARTLSDRDSYNDSDGNVTDMFLSVVIALVFVLFSSIFQYSMII